MVIRLTELQITTLNISSARKSIVIENKHQSMNETVGEGFVMRVEIF